MGFEFFFYKNCHLYTSPTRYNCLARPLPNLQDLLLWVSRSTSIGLHINTHFIGNHKGRLFGDVANVMPIAAEKKRMTLQIATWMEEETQHRWNVWLSFEKKKSGRTPSNRYTDEAEKYPITKQKVARIICHLGQPIGSILHMRVILLLWARIMCCLSLRTW